MRRFALVLAILAVIPCAVDAQEEGDEARARAVELQSGMKTISKELLGTSWFSIHYNNQYIGFIRNKVTKGKSGGKPVYLIDRRVEAAIPGSIKVLTTLTAKLNPDLTVRLANGRDVREKDGKSTDQKYAVKARGKKFLWQSSMDGGKPEVKQLDNPGGALLGGLALNFPLLMMELARDKPYKFAVLDVKKGSVSFSIYQRGKSVEVEVRGEKQKGLPVAIVSKTEKTSVHLHLESGQLMQMVDKNKIYYFGSSAEEIEQEKSGGAKTGQGPSDTVAKMFAAAASKDKRTLYTCFDLRKYLRYSALSKADGPEARAMAADKFDKKWRSSGAKMGEEFIKDIIKNPYWKGKPKTVKAYRAYCTPKLSKDRKSATVYYNDGKINLTYYLEKSGKLWKLVGRDY